MKSLVGLAGLTLCASLVAASEPIPFDSPRWQIEAEENRIEEHEGKTSLVLRGGLALVTDAEFTDGVIEYFCAFPEARAFVGATWRVQDAFGLAALPRGGLRNPRLLRFRHLVAGQDCRFG